MAELDWPYDMTMWGEYNDQIRDARRRRAVNAVVPLSYSMNVKVGEPVVIPQPIFGSPVLIMHPTDYVWHLLGRDDPQLAHAVVMQWIDWRCEEMARAAEERLRDPTETELWHQHLDKQERIMLHWWDGSQRVPQTVYHKKERPPTSSTPDYLVTDDGRVVEKPTMADLFPDVGPQPTSDQRLAWIEAVLEHTKQNPFGAIRLRNQQAYMEEIYNPDFRITGNPGS